MFRWSRYLKPHNFRSQINLSEAHRALFCFQPCHHFSVQTQRQKQYAFNLSYLPKYNYHSSNENANIYKDAVARLRILTKEQIPKYHTIVEKYVSSPDKRQLTSEEATAMLIVLFEVGRHYQNKAADEQALNYYFEGLDLAKKTGLDNSWEAAFINSAIGAIHLFKGDLSQAQEYLEKGNSIASTNTDTNTLSHLNIQNLCMLSLLYEKQDKSSRAVDLLLETQAKMAQADPASISPVTWVLLHDHLGQRYLNLKNKDIGKAIENWKKGLEIAVKDLGENSYEARIFYKHLSATLESINRFPEAFTYAYKLYKSNTGPSAKTQDTIDSLKAIGRLYVHQGKYGEALNALNKAQEIIKASPEQFSEDSIQIYQTMAGLYFGQNKFVEAQNAVDSAEKTIIRVYGEDSPKLAEHYDLAANLFRSLKQTTEQGLKYFQKALDFYKKLGDTEKNKIVNIYILLAETYLHRENPEGALKYLQEALDLCLKAPEATELLEPVYNFFALSYSIQGKYEDTAKNYAQAIRLCELSDNASEGMAYYCYNLGRTYEEMKSFVHAKGAYQILLDYNIKKYGKEDLRTKESAEMVLGALHRLNQPEEAKRLQDEYGIKPVDF